MCCVIGATGLPKSSRVAPTNTLIGFHEAIHCKNLGNELIGTNAVLRNVIGNTTTKPTPITASGDPAVEMPKHWRDAISAVAERSRDALRRHPWILDIADDPPIGPNSVRHFDQSLAAVSSLPISFAEKLDIVTVVDEYVFGFCLLERNNLQSVAPSVPGDMVTYVSGLVETGDYPQLAALAAEVGIEAGWQQVETHLRDADRFGRNLARLLDGIHAGLPQ